MTKFFAAWIAGLMVLSSAACGADLPASEAGTAAAEKLADGGAKAAESAFAPGQQPESEAGCEQQRTGTDSLVVYFSWSGNTESVAQEIQLQTGADIFEILPASPYGDDYNQLADQAQAEQKEQARPEISNTIEHMDSYSTIYVGYPIWWGDMPMILYTFFDTYDLSGKTILPFCTSGGSGLSNTVSEIASLEPEAAVLEGLHIGRPSPDLISGQVETWLADSEI